MVSCAQSKLIFVRSALIDITSNAKELTFTLTDPKGKRLEQQTGKPDFKYHFAAFTPGNHQICIQNVQKVAVTFQFTIQSGVQALDYTNIVTKKHLKPVELQAQKVIDMVEQIRNDLGSLVVNEERLKEANTKIKTRVVIFGLISVAVMGASTYVQITYLKNFFRNKKII